MPFPGNPTYSIRREDLQGLIEIVPEGRRPRNSTVALGRGPSKPSNRTHVGGDNDQAALIKVSARALTP